MPLVKVVSARRTCIARQARLAVLNEQGKAKMRRRASRSLLHHQGKLRTARQVLVRPVVPRMQASSQVRNDGIHRLTYLHFHRALVKP